MYKIANVYLNPEPPLYKVSDEQGKIVDNVAFVRQDLKLTT